MRYSRVINKQNVTEYIILFFFFSFLNNYFVSGCMQGGKLRHTKQWKRLKDYIFREKGPFKSFSGYYYYFCCFDEKRISSEYIPRMKVLIFADSMYYRFVIVEMIQTQYFYNLVSNCRRVFWTITLRLCIKFANINALFLATFYEPILVFVRTTKLKTTATYRFERALLHTSLVFFHCYIWCRFPPGYPFYKIMH